MGAHPGAVHARMAEGDPAVVTGPEPGGVSLMAIECSERPRRPREWRRGMATPGERRDMRTVPLHGKKAAGRVAVVDDEDYELVSPYRWHVLENPRPGRINGPYAAAGHSHVLMHNLILGVKALTTSTMTGWITGAPTCGQRRPDRTTTMSGRVPAAAHPSRAWPGMADCVAGCRHTSR